MKLFNGELPSAFLLTLPDEANHSQCSRLGYTYLYVRMLGSPSLYSVDPDYQTDDPLLIQKRSDIAHTAAVLLEKSGLIRYDRRSGVFQTNELGRIASGYYVSHTSMGTYNQQLKSATGFIELFRIFSLSEEFKNVPVRAEEK
jgi:pre-mRNA-splicing helicase BRR2